MTKQFSNHICQLRTLSFRFPLVFALASVFAVSGARAEEPAADRAVVSIQKVRAFRDGDTFATELQTSSAWNGNDVQVQYFKDSIQVDIAGATLNKGKQLIKVEDRAFKSVYATQFDEQTVRARFTVKGGLSAKTLAGRFHAKRGPSALIFEITGDANETLEEKAAAKTTAAKITDEPRTVTVHDESALSDSFATTLTAGAAVVAAVTKPLESSATTDPKSDAASGPFSGPLSSAATDVKKVDTAKLPENQIPVLSSAKNEKKSESSPFFRLMATLGVLAVALGAAAYGVKKMANRTGKKSESTRIHVLTTHHLGPKKNLMIVQVAGETLLIGVTDQNITMLKTLALIDDEVPADVPRRFDQSMEDFLDEGQYDGQSDGQPVADMPRFDQIRDTVSARIKNMRNL